MACPSFCTSSWAPRLPCFDSDSSSRFGGRNLSGDLLPSLGATTQQPPKLRKHLVSPYDPRYKYELSHCCMHVCARSRTEFIYFLLACRVWEIFLILLVVYSAWICPLEFAFLRYLPRAPFIVDDVVNGFFAVDIVLTFFVPYVDSKSYLLVDDPKKIAVRYGAS